MQHFRWSCPFLMGILFSLWMQNVGYASAESVSRPLSNHSFSTTDKLLITEFLVSNTSILMDGDGEYSDWIEIYNPTGEAVCLNDWFLTDDANDLTMWKFPSADQVDLTLQSGNFMIVFVSAKEDSESNEKYIDAEGYVHTNFKLSTEGESIALVASDGVTVVSAYWDYPAQRSDVSYGVDSSDVIGYFVSATPRAANSSAILGFVEDTKFSVDRGFYSEAFELAITTSTEGATIRYTLNGSDPTETNGNEYTGPIQIGGTTILRAAAFKDDYQSSNIDTQTYLFVGDIVNQSPTGEKPTSEWPNAGQTSSGGRPGQGGQGGGQGGGSQVMNYGMDPDVTGDSRYAELMDDALLAIPSLSIVTPLSNLFNTSTGIYMNPSQDGIAWERPVSVELLNPDGSEGFQVNAGLRIRGGVTRSTSNPKHSFRLFFRADYGDAKLKYPLFDDEGVEEFDKVDLRTASNFSWSYSDAANCTFLYDIFTRDAQREMGQPYTRSRYYHLYLDGVYWGLYQSEERPEANYGASYFGGSSDDYDTIKADNDTGVIYATDGSLETYQKLWTEATSGFTDNEDYFRVQGLNADGLTTNSDYPRLLDIDNLIDYMLLIYYAGNRDSPLGPPGSDSKPRNLYALINRNAPNGFFFITHDNEQTLGVGNSQGGSSLAVSLNRVNVSLNSSLSQQKYFNPWWLHNKLMSDNSEYRLRFADRVQKYFFHDGVLTAEQSTNRFLARKEEIDMAIIAESARWGDYLSANDPRTKDDDWLPIVNKIVNNYFNASPSTRTDIVLGQIKSKGWFPSVGAPEFSQNGGIVDPGFSFTIEAASGVVYYTLDGTDPRLPGGSINSSAIEYAGESIPIHARMTVQARALDGETWSPVSEAIFGVENDVKTYLRITEIQYHPKQLSEEEKTAGVTDRDDLEFIEFFNTSEDQTLDLSDVQLTNGVVFNFGQGSIKTLAPGQFALVVSSTDAFSVRYGEGLPIAGVYEGHLDNGGERVELQDANETVIHSFEYDDQSPWPEEPDGQGSSLEVIDTEGDYNDSTNWQASAVEDGTPQEWNDHSGETRIWDWIDYESNKNIEY